MPVPRRPGIPHSDHPGVHWDERRSKWRGSVYDRSVRAGKRAKQIHVGYFADEQACADACAAKLAQVDAANVQKLHAMAQELEHTRNLPLRPKHAADAQPETAYYGEKVKGAKGSEAKAFGPQRLVRVAHKSRPGGFYFHPCCIATLDSGAPCTSVATRDGLPLVARIESLRVLDGKRSVEGEKGGVEHVRATLIRARNPPPVVRRASGKRASVGEWTALAGGCPACFLKKYSCTQTRT